MPQICSNPRIKGNFLKITQKDVPSPNVFWSLESDSGFLCQEHGSSNRHSYHMIMFFGYWTT